MKQQAVLFRTSSHSGALEVELTRCNIPYGKFGGLRFLDAAHVKDVMAVLRFLRFLRLLRLLNSPSGAGSSGPQHGNQPAD